MHHGKVSPAIARGLLALRERIKDARVPASKVDETLNIATWNIRELGNKARSTAAVLGPYWRAVYSDVIADPGGNRERLGFIYDSRTL